MLILDYRCINWLIIAYKMLGVEYAFHNAIVEREKDRLKDALNLV